VISVKEAKQIIAQNIIERRSHFLPLHLLEGKILAKDIYSPINVPYFHNSAMDGYAVSETDEKLEWVVKYHIQAGDTQLYNLKKGEAARIFTGAMIPENTWAVIAQENIEKKVNDRIFYSQVLPRGMNIRKEGEQCLKDDLILKQNQIINVGTIALLASIGLKEVPIYVPLSVTIIITGNELKRLGEPLEKGQIYESNGVFLFSYLKKLGIENINIYYCEDDFDKLKNLISETLEKCDFLICSGGISVGEYDYVKKALKENQIEELFYKIRQKPGKPLWVGKKLDTLVFALPGNPVSVAVCFNQYVKPCLLSSMGYRDTWLPSCFAPLQSAYEKKSGLTQFLKINLESSQANILQGQESFNLLSFRETTHIGLIEEQDEHISLGMPIALFEW